MTDGSVPAIPAWQPVAQVGRPGRTSEQKKKPHSFEEDLAGGGGPTAKDGGRPDRPPPPADPAENDRIKGSLEDGTGESLDVTA